MADIVKFKKRIRNGKVKKNNGKCFKETIKVADREMTEEELEYYHLSQNDIIGKFNVLFIRFTHVFDNGSVLFGTYFSLIIQLFYYLVFARRVNSRLSWFDTIMFVGRDVDASDLSMGVDIILVLVCMIIIYKAVWNIRYREKQNNFMRCYTIVFGFPLIYIIDCLSWYSIDSIWNIYFILGVYMSILAGILFHVLYSRKKKMECSLYKMLWSGICGLKIYLSVFLIVIEELLSQIY